MMKKYFLFMTIFALSIVRGIAQVGINSDNSTPDPSAMLDVKSTTKGSLLPRMTYVQMGSIASPADGLQVYCTTDGKMYIYVATAGVWKEVAYGTGTLVPGTCGSLTITHVAGTVCPVNKTVTYGTVTNITNAPGKCWITSNLGADHQATAVDDATEASAGWYWQFNRKQGYKYEGTTRTPNSTWIFGIDENQNWQPANDPCTLQLGAVWHIPTFNDWNNLDFYGGWTDWNGPWNSGLKLHAAGGLYTGDGSLIYRGVQGLYWSNTEESNPMYGYDFGFDISVCGMGGDGKSMGTPLRCIRDN